MAERYPKWLRQSSSLSLRLCCHSTILLPPYPIHYLPTYIHPTTQHMQALGAPKGPPFGMVPLYLHFTNPRHSKWTEPCPHSGQGWGTKCPRPRPPLSLCWRRTGGRGGWLPRAFSEHFRVLGVPAVVVLQDGCIPSMQPLTPTSVAPSYPSGSVQSIVAHSGAAVCTCQPSKPGLPNLRSARPSKLLLVQLRVPQGGEGTQDRQDGCHPITSLGQETPQTHQNWRPFWGRPGLETQDLKPFF